MASNIQQTLASLEVVPPQGSWDQLSARLDAEYDLPEITRAQKLEPTTMQPPSGAWSAIAAALPVTEEHLPARPSVQPSLSEEAAPAKVFPFSLRKIAVAAAVMGIIALGSWYFLRSDSTVVPAVQLPVTAQKESQPATSPATQPAIAAPVIAQRNQDHSIRPLRVATDRSDNSNEETPISNTDQTTAANESQEEIPPTNPAIVQATDVAGPAAIPNRPFRDATGRVVMDMNLINNSGTQYVTVTAPNGEQTRMNKKFLPILTFLNTGADNGQFNTSLKQRFQNWRNQLIQQASFVPSATNFLDIMELKELLQDK